MLDSHSTWLGVAAGAGDAAQGGSPASRGDPHPRLDAHRGAAAGAGSHDAGGGGEAQGRRPARAPGRQDQSEARVEVQRVGAEGACCATIILDEYMNTCTCV